MFTRRNNILYFISLVRRSFFRTDISVKHHNNAIISENYFRKNTVPVRLCFLIS